MHPPWSMIFFTTLAGAAQGLMLALVGIDLAATVGLIVPVPLTYFYLASAGVVLLFCVVALAAAIASMDGLRNLGWVPDLSPPFLALAGLVIGLVGTAVFWGTERMLEYVFNSKPYPPPG